jgi:hypothetical protein
MKNEGWDIIFQFSKIYPSFCGSQAGNVGILFPQLQQFGA